MNQPGGRDESRPTLQDVAKACGCSVVTVSDALLDRGRISQATRNKVREKAQELGYRPNRFARALRTGKTNTLGLVIAKLGDMRLAATFAALEQSAAAAGYSLLVASAHSGPEAERGGTESLVERGVEGLIVFPRSDDSNVEYFRGLVEEGFPVVFAASCDLPVEGDYVGSDNERAGRLAASHFLKLGRDRVAFATIPDAGKRFPWSEDRRRGLDKALEEAGVPPSLVLTAPWNGASTWVEPAYQALSAHLAAHERPEFNALFTANDIVAWGVLQALREGGVDVPGEVVVIGYDDDPWTAFLTPTLTTFRRPDAEIGQECVRLLLERLEHGYDRLPRQRILLEPTLVVRQSTGGA